MTDLWNPDQTSMMDEFSLLTYAGDQLLAAELCSPVMGGSISLKGSMLDLYELEVETLVFRTSEYLTTENSTILRLQSLKKLMGLKDSPKSLSFELTRSRLDDEFDIPNLDTLIHAIIPENVTIFSTHNSSLALGSILDWQNLIQKIFNDRLLPIDYLPDKWETFKLVEQQINKSGISEFDGIFLRFRGVITFGKTCNDTFNKTIEISQQSEKFCYQNKTLNLNIDDHRIENETSWRVARSQLRREISAEVGKPLLVKSCGYQPSEMTVPNLTDIFSNTFSPDSTSRIISNTKMGHSVTARTPTQLKRNHEIWEQTKEIAELGKQVGRLEPLPVIRRKHYFFEKEIMFNGEVALVTGAASGIGKAVVMALIERGAAVVGLDIQTDVLTLTDSNNYLGFVCDLTNETEVINAFDEVVKAFGGLDMLVLNAGLFPDSCNIEELSLDYWQRVMQINLDANVTLFREVFPLLKNAPRYGRVVINASRNVPAPGPGAAAYSSSKAALTQLGRVAALEWGKSGVRVNMVNPHAVFDTGIWTQEVLQSRANHYGITVEEYKTNNVLGVELTSQDVGELIAEICGPIFSKITGAQIPVDGGSERVI